MPEQYTPTTDEMRWVYVRDDRAALSREEYEAEFDRWLAEVERAAAEKALTDAADAHETIAGKYSYGGSWLRALAGKGRER